MTRIVARTYYVLESDREVYRLVSGGDCSYAESLSEVFYEMAHWQMFATERYRYRNSEEQEARWGRVHKRLTRLLAFWHRNDVQPEASPEIVICAAIRLPDGYIVRGHRHADCINRAFDMPRYKENWECPFDDDQGFITSRNRYVTREEGLALQKAAGIPSADPSGYRARELFSEDLYA